LNRAYKTAQIVAKKQSLEVVTTPSLREWNAGVLDGLPAARLEEAITKSQLPLGEFTPDDGESFSQLRERAINFLATLETYDQGQVIMVCTHGDLLRVLVGSILEKDLESSMIIEFDNTSYTTIVLNNNGKWIVESINQVP
jgi:broad specificity phosphatase PhoE